MSRLPVLCDFKYLCAYLSPAAARLLWSLVKCHPVHVQPNPWARTCRELPIPICLNTTLHTNTSGQSPPFQCIIPLVVLLYHPKLQFMFPQCNGTKVHYLCSTSLSLSWKMAPPWGATVHVHICLYSNRDCSLHYLLSSTWKQLPWAFGLIS